MLSSSSMMPCRRESTPPVISTLSAMQREPPDTLVSPWCLQSWDGRSSMGATRHVLVLTFRLMAITTLSHLLRAGPSQPNKMLLVGHHSPGSHFKSNLLSILVFAGSGGRVTARLLWSCRHPV